MVTVRKSKLLTPTSVIPENTYYYEFDCDTIAELPTATYQGTNVAHGSLATIIANGRQYRLNGEGEWCIQRYDASDPILIEKTITENGTYTALDEDVDGYSSVIANVPNTYTAGDEGKVVDNGELVAQTARAESITANGTYDTTNNNSVTVDVVSENNAKFDLPANKGTFSIQDALEYIKITSGGIGKALTTQCFMGCTNLKIVDMRGSGIEQLRTQVFQNCTSLETIYLPETLVGTSSTNQFLGCTSLKNIELPNTFLYFGGANFAKDCTLLEYIKFNSTTPPTAVANVFANIPTTCKILVPTGTINAYKAQANFPDPNTYTYEEF